MIESIDKFTVKFIPDEKFKWFAGQKADQIIGNGQSNGRSHEQVVEDCTRGYMTEIAVSEWLGVPYNYDEHLPFNYKDPETYSFDIRLKNGKRMEVKTIGEKNSGNDKYLNVNQKSFKKDYIKYAKYPEVETALNNKNDIDLIAFFTNDNGVIKMKYLFDMGIFATNVEFSKYDKCDGSDSTHFLRNPHSFDKRINRK